MWKTRAIEDDEPVRSSGSGSPRGLMSGLALALSAFVLACAPGDGAGTTVGATETSTGMTVGTTEMSTGSTESEDGGVETVSMESETSGGDPTGVWCYEEGEVLVALDEVTPFGVTGAEILAIAAQQTTGLLSYASGGATEIKVTFEYSGGSVAVVHAAEVGCEEYGNVLVRGTAYFTSDDGKFAEVFATQLGWRPRLPDSVYISHWWSPLGLEEWIPAPYKLADFDYIDLKLQVFFGMVDEYESDASGLTIRGVTPIPEMCDKPECEPTIVEAPVGAITLDPPA